MCDSSAIAQIIVKKGNGKLLGADDVSHAQVEQWLIYLRTETLPLVNTIKMFTFGHAPCDVDLYERVEKDFKENIKTINSHLNKTKFLVGYELTLADIYFALTQVEMQ